MKMTRILTAVFLLMVCSETACADGIKGLFKALHEAGRALHHKKPDVEGIPPVEEVADQIDHLEHVIETYGSVVPKQPDIWGEARLTKHRRDYEREIAKRFTEEGFSATLQASIRRSDQAFLAGSLALSSAVNGATPLTPGDPIAVTQDTTFALVPGQPQALVPGGVARAPLGPARIAGEDARFAGGPLALEPVIEVAQLSRYLNYLNELRRINEGDDTADAPGYALNLVRLPISVLPGALTRKGYGAEVTFTVDPVLTEDLLPTTVENLIINDVVDQFSVPMARFYNNDPIFSKFVVTNWDAAVNRANGWMTVYDRYAKYLDDASEHDLAEYMRVNRCYIEGRLLGLALLARFHELKAADKLPEGLPQETDEVSEDFVFNRFEVEFRGNLTELALRFDDLVEVANRDGLRFVAEELPSPIQETDEDAAVWQKRRLLIRTSTDDAIARLQPYLGQVLNGRLEQRFVAQLTSLLRRRLPEHLTSEWTFNLQKPRDFRKSFDKWLRDRTRPVPFPVSVNSQIQGVVEYGPVNFVARELVNENARRSLAPNTQPTPEEWNKAKSKSAEELIKELNWLTKVGGTTGDEIVRILKEAITHQTRGSTWDGETTFIPDLAVMLDLGKKFPALAKMFENGENAKATPPTEKEAGAATNGDPAKKDATAPARWSYEYFGNRLATFNKNFAHELRKNFEQTMNYDNEVSIALTDVGVQVPAELTHFGAHLPVRSQTAQRPVPPSQFGDVYGYGYLGRIARDGHRSLRVQPANHPIIHVFDIRKYLQEELKAAYAYLKCPENIQLWELCGGYGPLASAIRCGDAGLLSKLRSQFGEHVRSQQVREYPHASRLKPSNVPQPGMHGTITEALSWAILVQAALVNERLIQDMNSVSTARRCGCMSGEGINFVKPKGHLLPDAHKAFEQYVRCKWPIYVFNLDPLTDDQNVADVFSRRRELQLAASMAVANGEMSGAGALRFTRNLETDIETVALNRTAVAFSHGKNTFGWRFYPRVQTPDTPGTLVAFGQTLFGGPSRDSDLKHRELEPAIRDCVAVVIMPSFVPNLIFESRANWFGLTNPRKKALNMHDAMKISRNYQAIQHVLPQLCNPDVYRPGDMAHMVQAVEQMEKRLPMQRTMVPVPHENDLGAFDLFDSGITSLGPELTGWYGAPGLDPHSSTTIFVTGKRFSVLETRLVVGGRYAPFRLISRNVMEVTVPPGFHVLADPRYNNFVDMHLATPYGPSSHLLVPTNSPQQGAGGRFVWATSTLAGTLHYKTAENVSTASFLATTAPPTITLRTPTLGAPTKLTVNLSVRNGERILSSGPVSAQLDVRSHRYVIGGDEFQKFAGLAVSAATTSFATTAPTSGSQMVLTVFGTVAVDDALPEALLTPMTLDLKLQLDK